ncbi:MAG: zinc carboxypeptidase, partial [bacterium]|nr:zinc carboxypeptidase [Candidatus Aquidulcis frankliniae]
MTRQARFSITITLATILVAGAPAARASDLWPGAFKSYEQIESEILAVEAAHPEIVDVFSIGQSYEGRELYAAKISDNITLDEGEPEVLIDALHHSNEHVTLAQALDLLHVLVDGYEESESITTLVDERVVWIVFAVNPDGLAFEFTENGPWNWRKNRQPTPGSASIGTDLNRNYGAYWRCCNSSTKNPASRIYAGPAKFSAPETAA